MTTSIDHQAQAIRWDALTRVRASLDAVVEAPVVNDLSWTMELFTAARKLGKVFDEHVNESEADLLPEVLALKPHLQRRVRVLREEHERLRQQIRDLLAAAETEACSPEIDVTRLRRLSGAVAGELRRHESRGINLVYEAFNRVDGFD
jgi:signal transduction histidine kinase